ncbi:GNAT family N-acetyltransferase [Streptomyces sp. NPDC002004]
MTLLTIPAHRVRLVELSRDAAAELSAGGTGGFDWIDGGPYEGTRVASGKVVEAHEAGRHRTGWGVYVIIRAEDGRALGAMGFHGAPDEEGRAEVGYDLAEAARGRGYATEALRALTAWAFTHPQLRTLRARIDPDNAPSHAVITRAGFAPAGTAKGGAGEDVMAYELTR